MTFRYEFTLSQSEHTHATRTVLNRRFSMRATYGLFAFVLFAGVAVVANDPADHYGYGFVFGALTGSALMYLSPYNVTRSLRKGNRCADQPICYEFSGSGLAQTAPGASSSVAWVNVIETYETRDFLLFYISTAWAYVLPKRAVPAQELVPLRNAIRVWVGECAHLHI